MNRIKKYYHLLTSIIVFILYMFTLAPSVIQIDSGELAAVQATLGIAHPTGYPLFTVLGYLFSLLPLPFTKIFQLNILAAIYCSAAIGVFTYTIKYCLDNLSSFKKKRSVQKESPKKERKKSKELASTEKQVEISENFKLLTAVFGGLVLAFSRTFWFQSTSVEVYSLHLLLITLIIFLLLKAYIKSFGNDRLTNWLVFSFFLALGFTNHLTTLMILPGTAYLYFSRYKFNSASFKKLVPMILLFVVVISAVYSYLPLRALQNPILNWGNPVDWERIYRHVSGKQYQVWLFSSFDSAGKQFSHFWSILPFEYFVGLLLALIGLFFSVIKSRTLAWFILITFVFTVLYSINYDIHDIDSYFLLAFIMISFFAAFGALKILEMKSLQKNFAIIILTVVIAIQLFFNFIKVNQSDVYTFEDYTKSVLNTVPENSIIFSYQWDYFISASYYYQFVEDYRRDVTVIDKELLRRSWYYNQIDKYDPEVLKGVRKEIGEFLVALQPFERDEKVYDAGKLESLYQAIMSNLITTNIDDRDYFIAPEVFEQEMRRGEFRLPDGFSLVPYLFFFKVVEGNEYVPAPEPDFTIRIASNRNVYIDNIENMIGRMLSNRAYYEAGFGKTDRAKIYLQKILKDLPGFKLHPALQEVLKN
jgi:tetratricopeptide (TPR) repeat protein